MRKFMTEFKDKDEEKAASEEEKKEIKSSRG